MRLLTLSKVKKFINSQASASKPQPQTEAHTLCLEQKGLKTLIVCTFFASAGSQILFCVLIYVWKLFTQHKCCLRWLLNNSAPFNSFKSWANKKNYSLRLKHNAQRESTRKSWKKCSFSPLIRRRSQSKVSSLNDVWLFRIKLIICRHLLEDTRDVW